jgi:hypothetical protein
MSAIQVGKSIAHLVGAGKLAKAGSAFFDFQTGLNYTDTLANRNNHTLAIESAKRGIDGASAKPATHRPIPLRFT